MGPKPTLPSSGDLYRSRLDQILDQRHELFRLATLIDWLRFDQEFGRFYRPLGRPAKPTRLMVGLLYLQHTFNLSDEAVVQRWIENPFWERRETGKEQVVQVHYDEGVATHIDPEPCEGNREAVVEASAGARAGQPLSHDRVFIPDADTLQYVEGNIPQPVTARAARIWRGRRPWHARTLFAREPGDLRLDRRHTYQPAARIGKARSRSR
ncbi:hypothetical protein MAE02_41300 [Microvirga aerophila]|uniref:Transposase InsH N-terminal domain-containing protein n=2 Tax=Microvirga aerophila TaxID=670291 RepID=A0A512BWW2_9HYPH|nr:hypothetical protein MAE02_41300 [Microvirga aerophila]